MNLMLFLSLGANVILFGLLIIYHIVSEDECKKLRGLLRSANSKKPPFKRV